MNSLKKGVRFTPPPFFNRLRFYLSLAWTWLLNTGAPGARTRALCSPGFNCHGCPLATAACPAGVLSYSASIHTIPLVVLGFIFSTGLFFGRLVCSYVCPFGLLQELLFRVPVKKYFFPRFFDRLKYLLLLLLVLVFPFILGLDVSSKYFLYYCRACPNGTLTATIPAILRKPASSSSPETRPSNSPSTLSVQADKPGTMFTKSLLRGQNPSIKNITDADISETARSRSTSPAVLNNQLPFNENRTQGGSFPLSLLIRLSILAIFLTLMLFFSRPFCRSACPLGAIYGLLAPFSLYTMKIDITKCISCRKCNTVCPMELDVPRELGGRECIACGECIKVCPVKIISRGFK